MTLKLFNIFIITVTPQSVLLKYRHGFFKVAGYKKGNDNQFSLARILIESFLELHASFNG